MRKVFRRIHFLLNRARLDRELEEEMAAHRAMMPPERHRAFGNATQIREEIKNEWGWTWADQFLQDLLYAWRGFHRERQFTLSALTTITLTVGAATAIFSVVDRSLFRPLPYAQGDHLVSLSLVMPSFGNGDYMFLGAYRDWQHAQTAVDLTSWSGVAACDLGNDAPHRLSCARIEATFLPLLGVQPLLGRGVRLEDDTPGSEPVALISHKMWEAQFGSDHGVIGKRITLDGTSTRIIGVLPKEFETPDLSPADVFVPQKLPQESAGRRNVPVSVVGRLRSDTSLESAAAALAIPFELFRSDFGARAGDNFAKEMRLQIEFLRDKQNKQHRLALWMLLGAVAAFVFIGCANVTNLLLARSVARRPEFAMRSALGASKPRLFRQTLTESGLLALAGGVAGSGLAWSLLHAFVVLAPDGALRLPQATLDLRVMGFALVLSLSAMVVFGLAPVLEPSFFEPLGERPTGPRRNRFRRFLVTSQIAVSLLLLSGAGLCLTSLRQLQSAPLGFELDRIVTASFILPAYRYVAEDRQLSFFEQLEAHLGDVPGALAFAIADSVPPGPATRTAAFVNFVDPSANLGGQEMSGTVMWRYVTRGYFKTLGIPIQRGRAFSDEDKYQQASNVIVSESLARRVFGDGNPIGRRLGTNIVIGVAGDVRNRGLDRPADLEFYRVRKNFKTRMAGSSDPEWPRRATVVVRSRLSAHEAAESVQAAFRDVDAAIPLKVETMEQAVDQFLTKPRFQTALLSLFAATGLVLAGIGLYGLISFFVAERTREIGVRIALGARPSDIRKLVISAVARWSAAGIVGGTAGAYALSRLFQGLLFGVRSWAPWALTTSIILLSGVALLAAWLPARRAIRVDPMLALRQN